jgi:putative flippase GtrA
VQAGCRNDRVPRRCRTCYPAPMSLPAPIHRLAGRLQQSWRERAVVLKAISFAMVGVVNTLIDASVFFLIYALLTSAPQGPNFVSSLAGLCRCGSVENLTLIIANVFAWMIAVSGSYVMNSFTTFAHESGRTLRLRAYGTFVGSGVVSVIATTTTLVIVAQYLPVWAAKGLAILVSFVVNFTLSHFVVFRARKAPHVAADRD